MICPNCGYNGEQDDRCCPACFCAPGEFDRPHWMDEETWQRGIKSGWAPIDKSKSKAKRDQEFADEEALETWQKSQTTIS